MYTIDIFKNLASDGASMPTEISSDEGKRGQVELLYRKLKQDLLCAHFGTGERLIEERLAKKYGISSRTPVREALARLKSEGLISVRGRSFISSEFSAAALLKLYDVRLSLEILAVRGAAQVQDLSEVEKCLELMADAQSRGDAIAANASDCLFHLKISELSGNSFLNEMLFQIHEKVFQIRNLFFANEARDSGVAEDHMALMNAIKRGVPEVAAAEMEHHLTESRKKFRERLI